MHRLNLPNQGLSSLYGSDFCLSEKKKYLRETISEEERFILAPSCKSFSPRSLGTIVSGPAGSHGGAKLLTSWQLEGREKEKEE
jgi:hypothetical protein